MTYELLTSEAYLSSVLTVALQEVYGQLFKDADGSARSLKFDLKNELDGLVVRVADEQI